MKAKIFTGGTEKVENILNEWMSSNKLSIQYVAMSMMAKNTVGIVVLFDESVRPSEPKQRIRGIERPGEPPTCHCGRRMVLRHRKADNQPFWGCPGFPECRSIVTLDEEDLRVLESEKKRENYKEGDDLGSTGPILGGGVVGADYGDDDIPF